MGIPKMFRWLSERYPLCSQLVENGKIPEFDMNGIIHNATHNNMGAHQVLDDEKMYTSIFNYIEDLFNHINPKKKFFMAVDGVAPRAKMNQQRARRFRTAQDRLKEKEVSEKKGILVSEDSFDSNCITPGTEFMQKLTKHLKYFIHKKITEDQRWKSIDVILSSHEVPGEGEHKIMEYIRLAKAQPEYDPNTRHCLYGLDADLIMLGLLSHEPHFALLREEVTFGKKTQVRQTGPPTFYLLHLSLVREYFYFDFISPHEGTEFNFDLERVIDDLILLILFVGNDFLPHLPGFDIGDGILTSLFNSYISWMASNRGYLNDAGTVNFKNLCVFLKYLENQEYTRFLNVPDHEHLQSNKAAGGAGRGLLQLTRNQHTIVEKVTEVLKAQNYSVKNINIDIPECKSYHDIIFAERFVEELDLQLVADSTFDPLSDHADHTFKYSIVSVDTYSDDEEEEYSSLALNETEFTSQTLKTFLDAPIIKPEEEEEDRLVAEQAFKDWKADYYQKKLKIYEFENSKKNELVKSYAEGIQWVMYYYYHGIPSWGWYYPYHYSPMLSDLENIKDIHIEFEKGQPFRPFEQLMGVLPSLSKKLIPLGLQELMTNPVSPIIDFYPTEFSCDKNGKKNDWEAVVLIPFIDQHRLISAIKDQERLLTDAEKARNSFGEIFLLKQDPTNVTHTVKSTFPGYLPDIRSSCSESIFNLPELSPATEFLKGLCPGVKIGLDAPPGFPSINTISVTGFLTKGGIQVFDRPSKQESIVLTVKNSEENTPIDDTVHKILGQSIFVGYPFLTKAKVMKICNGVDMYESSGKNNKVVITPLSNDDIDAYNKVVNELEHTYQHKHGIITGSVDTVVYVAHFSGLLLNFDGSLSKSYDDTTPLQPYPLQLIASSIRNEDKRYMSRPPLPLNVEFPLKSKVFFLGDRFYGVPGLVTDNTSKEGKLGLKLIFNSEPANIGATVVTQSKKQQYTSMKELAKIIGCAPYSILRLTSRMKLSYSAKKKAATSINIGLGLKFELRKLIALEYCRHTQWYYEFTPKGCELICAFANEFPEVLKFIDNGGLKQSVVLAERMFPNDTAKRIEECLAWHKNNKIDSITLSPMGSESLDKIYVTQIEKFWDSFYESAPELKIFNIQEADRSTLLHPNHTGIRLERQKFYLGNRVVYVGSPGKVQVAARGTVIGIEETNLEVLFDRSFVSGTDLNERCSQHRGLWVPSTSLLNVSVPQLTPTSLNSFLERKISNFNPSSNPITKPAKMEPKVNQVTNRQLNSPNFNGNQGFANSNQSYSGLVAKASASPQQPQAIRTTGLKHVSGNQNYNVGKYSFVPPNYSSQVNNLNGSSSNSNPNPNSDKPKPSNL